MLSVGVEYVLRDVCLVEFMEVKRLFLVFTF
jgi:hypothetical protein